MPGIGAHTALPALRGEFRRQETSPGSVPGSARGSAPTASRDRISSRRPAAPGGVRPCAGLSPHLPPSGALRPPPPRPASESPSAVFVILPVALAAPHLAKTKRGGTVTLRLNHPPLNASALARGGGRRGGPCCPVPCLCRAVPRGSGTETGAGVSGGTGREGPRQHPPSSP